MEKVTSIKSPLLINHLNQTANNEKVYQQLVKHSNNVKPNVAKAKMVRENPIQAVKSAVTDTVQDAKNVFKTMKTGQMSDNNLGRINDLGMKIGAGIIALYLSSHAKTKTNSIMQFIGAVTFFSVMKLWPKLFINLPARLVHGFRIDQKYISAQGDKKDLYLDNQYIPTDVFTKEELRKNAKRSGIDFDSEKGQEKILRKMQKTALQNRTLWMGTAGFATPLFTAVIGDKIEPVIKKEVIKHGFEKSKNAMDNLTDTLNNSFGIVKNQKALELLIDKYALNLDETGLKEIASAMCFDVSDLFKDADDIKPVRDLKFTVNLETLKEIRKNNSYIQTDNLENLLKQAFLEEKSCPSLDALMNKYNIQTLEETFNISENDIKEIVKKFSQLKDGRTYQKLTQIIKETVNADEKAISQINSKLYNIDFKFDDTPFFKISRQYNNDVLASIRGKLKTYLNILNPVMGSKDESVYTQIYRDSMEKIFKNADFSTTDLKALRLTPNNTLEPQSVKVLSKFFQKFAQLNETEYKNAISSFVVRENEDEIEDLVKMIADKNNIAKIGQLSGDTDKAHFNSLTSGLNDLIGRNISHFCDVAKTNINAIKSKALISANLERQIASGSLEQALSAKGLITNSMPLSEWIQKARQLVYEGTVASDACKLELNANLFNTLKQIIYNEQNYKTEIDVFPEVKNILAQLINLKTEAKDNAVVTGLCGLVRTRAKEVLNNKAWKKIFMPMTIALVAVTLLAQPFFGNIKDEYPENKLKGDNK